MLCNKCTSLVSFSVSLFSSGMLALILQCKRYVNTYRSLLFIVYLTLLFVDISAKILCLCKVYFLLNFRPEEWRNWKNYALQYYAMMFTIMGYVLYIQQSMPTQEFDSAKGEQYALLKQKVFANKFIYSEVNRDIGNIILDF